MEKEPLKEVLVHARNCPQLNPASDDWCTCGLEFRIQLHAAREVARKRAERLESRDAAVKLAFDLIAKANTVSILSLDEMESVVLRCLSGEIKP